MDEPRYIRPIDMLMIHHLLDPDLIHEQAFNYWVKDRLIYFSQVQNGKRFFEAFLKASEKAKIIWFQNHQDCFERFLQEYQEKTAAYFEEQIETSIIEGTRPDNN
jgi:hypothetical protein